MTKRFCKIVSLKSCISRTDRSAEQKFANERSQRLIRTEIMSAGLRIKITEEVTNRPTSF